jgi:2-methylcitrate dehydratase
MTQVEALARYAARASFADLSAQSRQQLTVHILDSLGCCIAALGAGPIEACREQVADFGGDGPCALIGGGKANPIYAAFWHTGLVRYVDFMDNFLAPTETCHTADNFGVALSIADYIGGSGRDLMLAVALSYTVQSRFVDHANFMTRGFDHTTQLAFSLNAAAGPAPRYERAADCQRHRHGSRQRRLVRRRAGKAAVAMEGSCLGAISAGSDEHALSCPPRRRRTAASD